MGLGVGNGGNGFSLGKAFTAVVGSIVTAAILGVFYFATSHASEDSVAEVKRTHAGDLQAVYLEMARLEEEEAKNRAAINAGIVQRSTILRALDRIDANTRDVGDAPALKPSDLQQPELLN